MDRSVLVAMPISPRLRERLSEHYTVHGPLNREKSLPLPDGAEHAQVLVTLGGYMTDAALMAALPNLGLISCYGTGFEGVDRVEARRRGIKVTHAGDANAIPVAEFTIGLMIAAARNIVRGDRALRAGRWLSHPIDEIPVTPGLAGKRLGIYGLGTIGLKIAARVAGFEMQVGYHNRSRRSDVGYSYFASLSELAEWCDVLVVAVRASEENYHAVNGAVLRALGRKGVLINVSRGSVVDETALCEALETNVILSAALDVHEHEPHVSERLRALENVVLTPHIAAFSKLGQDAQLDTLMRNIDAFFAGGELTSLVSMP